MAGSSVDGAGQLLATLDAAAHDLANPEAADQAAGELLAGRIAKDAPKRTGHMAKTVASQVRAGHVEVTIGAPYAVYVVATNPWVARDVAASEDDLADLYATYAGDVIATVKGA